jgi:hypothetical protein
MKVSVVLQLLALFLMISLVLSIEIKINSEVLINQEPTLIKSVNNGQRLLIGDLNDPKRNILHIANLKGTPAEMGEAFGLLFKD